MKQLERRRGATGPNGAVPGTRAGKRLIAIVAIVASAAAVSIAGVQPAFAVDYPTWSDVQNARGNEAAKHGEVTRIRELLAGLAIQVAETQAMAIQRGVELQAAQQAYDEATYKAAELQLQADDAQEKADESKLRAGQLAARLARSGGDVSASLFFDGESADDLLSQLGMASKINDQSAGIYQKATQDQNNAQLLTDQANRAKAALQELADAAAAALAAANAAADAAAAALAEQEENRATLEAQLAVLVENRLATEADYMAGVAAREAAAAAQRAAQAAAAAAAAAAGGGGGGGSNGSGGASNAAGDWVRPSSGVVSSSFGWRIHPVYGDRRFHNGTDIGAGCGFPIFAASSGTVTYAGPNGGFGNYVGIQHAGGVTTAYGHMQNGGVLVGRGQTVSAGQVIGRVGTTGTSTGCHLHFEVRIGGAITSPIDFMRGRGVPF